MKRIKRLKNLPNDTVYTIFNCPIGALTILASKQGLHATLWEKEYHTEPCQYALKNFKKTKDHPVIKQTVQQLEEYFSGKRKNFDLPIAIIGTDFQMQAWHQLTQIPFGKTISYAEQAHRMGDKNKARPAGMANGANPISIIIPCHRVIGSNQKLTGYGGGLETKAFLLQLEQKLLANST